MFIHSFVRLLIFIGHIVKKHEAAGKNSGAVSIARQEVKSAAEARKKGGRLFSFGTPAPSPYSGWASVKNFPGLCVLCSSFRFFVITSEYNYICRNYLL